MTEELNTATTSPGAEGAPPSPTPSPAEATPAEQQPAQYLTRDEALRLVDDALSRQREAYEIAAREQGQRGAQSFIDKRRLEERMKSTEAAINAMVQDGLLEPSQASSYRERARSQALIDLATEGPEPQPAAETQPDQAEADRIAWHLIRESGLTEADPEWQGILGHADFPTWHAALQKAAAAKAARLARAQAAQNAAPPAPAPPPATPPPTSTGVAAVEVGASGGAAVTDLPTLRQQYLAAQRKGDRTTANRLYKQIQALTVGAAR